MKACWLMLPSPLTVFGEKELKEGQSARSMSPALSELKVSSVDSVSIFLMAQCLTPGVQEVYMLVF